MLVLFAQSDAPRFAVDSMVREHWRVLVPLVVGFLGLFLLLPRVRRSLPALGGALAGLAIVLAGVWWLRPEAFWVENLLFYAFSALALLGAGMMLAQHNPVHAALSFALVVLSTCGLFLILAAPFLMAATLVIYAGAIVVTFLFVIMLAQQAGISNADLRSREPFLASLAGLVLLGALVIVIEKGFDTRAMDNLLARLERLSAAGTKEEAFAVMGQPPAGADGEKSSPLVSEIRQTFPDLAGRTRRSDAAAARTAVDADNLESAWASLNQSGDLAKVRQLATSLLDRGRVLRQRGETLEPARGAHHVPGTPGTLPARNVAAIGNTLFTDYLIPVELAGVLLLVATIGAIAIAGRRPEGLR